MEDIARAVIGGIAIGGFVSFVIEANLLALKTLWRFNYLAAETSFEMFQGLKSKQLERKRQRERLRELRERLSMAAAENSET